MTTANRAFRLKDSVMPAAAMLTVAMLAVAALLNGVGAVGVMAPAHERAGYYVELPELSPAERVSFTRVGRAIERLHLPESGRADQFEIYGSLLQVLSESLPASPGDVVLDRVRKLLSGSLPPPAVNDIMSVLPLFLAYQQAEKALLGLSPGAPGSIEGAYLHLRLQNALRESILGASITHGLFSASYRMTRIHLERQMLMQRKDLSEREKRRLIREQVEALNAEKSPGDAG